METYGTDKFPDFCRDSHICNEGHFLCDKCIGNMEKCPWCRGRLEPQESNF